MCAYGHVNTHTEGAGLVFVFVIFLLLLNLFLLSRALPGHSPAFLLRAQDYWGPGRVEVGRASPTALWVTCKAEAPVGD